MSVLCCPTWPPASYPSQTTYLDAGFKGEPQQGLIRSDIHDLDAAFYQFF